jgi:protoporphyrin/coproporphyrin ferrochelatase
MNQHSKRAILLLNLGTPEALSVSAVRKYLREFLMDGRVIDIPKPLRWLLVNGVIAPFRGPKSFQKYQKVWTEAGSPLLMYSEAQRRLLAEKMPEERVLLAMRYGSPSIADALQSLQAFPPDELIVVPLYPQYASASSGSSLEAVYEALMSRPFVPAIKSVPAFYAHPDFIESWAQVIRETLKGQEIEHMVFSYHGLPERQVCATDATGMHCLKAASCCDDMNEKNRACYRAQCFETSRRLQKTLGLASVSTSFQSRLGRTPWIQPFSDEHFVELAKKGIKHVAVACPSFVSDCLETLEEVHLELKDTFLKAGGQSFTPVPCLNSHPRWIEALFTLVQEA